MSRCQHKNDKIVHGVYHNYQHCNDCGRNRGKKGAFKQGKYKEMQKKRVECSKGHTDFYIFEFKKEYQVYCLKCRETVKLPKFKQEKVK